MADPDPPEQRFLAFARDRDPALLEALLHEHADRAYALARRILGRRDLAEDAVQEACIALLATANRYRPEVPFAAWLYRLVSCAALTLRQRAEQQRRMAEAAALNARPAEEADPHDASREAMRAALAALPERYRMPLELYYFADLDQEGVGKALGLSTGAAAMRLSRGLHRLRASMERLGFASSASSVVALLGGLPSYPAAPSLHAALAGLAAKPALAAGSAGAAGMALVAKSSVIVAAIALAVVAVHVARSHPAPAAAAPTVQPAVGGAMPGSAAPSTGAALVDAMAPGSWMAVPRSHLRAVAPDPKAFPGIQLVGGVTGIVVCSGAAFDSRRELLVLWGGGGPAYAGNELYAFSVASLTWERLTDPNPAPATDGEVNADGTPAARMTYNGLAYIAHADRLLAKNGVLAGSPTSSPSRTWTFDFTAKRWSDRAPATSPHGAYGDNCSYDPATRQVWWGCSDASGKGFAGLWSYDYDRNAWTKRNSDDFYDYTSAIDTKRGNLVVVGRGQVFSYGIARDDYRRMPWTTTGGDACIADAGPGFDYDPQRDRFVCWNGGAVYALDPETKAWTADDPPGAPLATGLNRNGPGYKSGIFGRWRYVPSLKAFIVVTDVDDDVYFYKP